MYKPQYIELNRDSCIVSAIMSFSDHLVEMGFVRIEALDFDKADLRQVFELLYQANLACFRLLSVPY